MSSEGNKEYSVNWKNHMSHVRKAFDNLLTSNELTDVTLCCEGKKIGAHKMLLSACSGYFRDTFKDVPCQHPVIFMYGVEYVVLSDILHFIYNGEVSVDTTKLDIFLKTAQLLQISGLTDGASERLTGVNDSTMKSPQVPEQNTDETCAQTIATNSMNEDARRGMKRVREMEMKDKLVRQENDTAMFISDVKCEPSELVNFEDPLEDPLLQSDQGGDTKEFYVAAPGQSLGEEEFKRPTENASASGVRKNTQSSRNFCSNGYNYFIERKDWRNSRIYWRCQKYKTTGCIGRIITDMESNLIRVSAKHVHPPFQTQYSIL